MTARFVDRHENRIDDKGRVSVPAPFRAIIAAGHAEREPGRHPSFYLVYDPRKKTVRGYTVAEHERLLSGASKIENPKLRKAVQLQFSAFAAHTTLDANGRIQVTPKLREIVGEAKMVEFVGEDRCFRMMPADETESTLVDEFDALSADLEEGLDLTDLIPAE